ncbi:hypothetical protein ACVWWO_009150 [Bradyrhizobium sp. F1.13.1]
MDFRESYSDGPHYRCDGLQFFQINEYSERRSKETRQNLALHDAGFAGPSYSRPQDTYAALAEGRNQLLHNPIGRSFNDQVYIMLRTPVPRTGRIPYEAKPISPSEIDGLSAEIRAFVLELVDLQKEIMKAQHPGTSLFGGLFPRE